MEFFSPKEMSLMNWILFGNARGKIFMEKFHPERVVKLWATPTLTHCIQGGPPPNLWILSTRPCCWVTWHWCWCSYLSTTWRDAGATKQFVEKWWKMVETRHHKGMSQRWNIAPLIVHQRSSTTLYLAITFHGFHSFIPLLINSKQWCTFKRFKLSLWRSK